MSKDQKELKAEILKLVAEYCQVAHGSKEFVQGQSRVSYAGRVFDSRELVNLVDSSLDFWLTAGPYAAQLENRFRQYFKSRDFVLVNSGSSANLLMVSVLCAKELNKILRENDLRPLEAGDEVITPAVTFPTTLAPILQNSLIPTFVDCEVGTYNVNPALLEGAIGPRTRAVFIPHTLGNPFHLNAVAQLCKKHNLWLLEDGCDALGSEYDGKLVGTFGAMSSVSFYPAHHITMGEGGGVCINHPRLQKTARSIRDWGRDCWCDPGISDTCGKRFGWKLGDLPQGYDHKYTYSNIGYNLKLTDMQAAIGLAQLDKLPGFIEARRRNFKFLYENLKSLQGKIELPVWDKLSNPSPFGFPVTVNPPFERSKLIAHLEAANIETRLVFGGNVLRQPGFLDIEHRICGELTQSDRIMNDTFFIGVYPGLTQTMLEYVVSQFKSFF